MKLQPAPSKHVEGSRVSGTDLSPSSRTNWSFNFSFFLSLFVSGAPHQAHRRPHPSALRKDAHSSLLGNADISCYPAPLCVCDGKRGPPGAHYRSCQMIGAEWRLPRDAEHVVSAATRRQRQMAWVPAAGMSVIPQRERERSRRECGGERGEGIERRQWRRECEA